MKRYALGLSLLVLFSLATIQSNAVKIQEELPAYGGTLVVTIGYEPLTFNSMFEAGATQYLIMVLGTLVRADYDGSIIAGFAKSWDISSDGLTYTFQLYENVTFHDGVPLTSNDIKYTFDVMRNPDTGAVRYSDLKIIANIEAPADYTIVFHLEEQSALFLLNLAGLGILPKHIWENADLQTSEYNYKPVGAGPWNLTDWVKLDHMTFEAYDNYHLGRPYMDKIIMKVTPEPAVQLTAVEAGDVDYLPYYSVLGSLEYSLVNEAKKNPDLVVSGFGSLSIQFLYFSCDKPPFNNTLVRQAICHAIDRDFIIDTLLLGYAEKPETVLPVEIWCYNQDVPVYNYDPAKAEQLLDEAGYPRLEGEVRFHTTIYATPGFRVTMSEAIKEYMRTVGIEANIVSTEWTAYWAKLTETRDQNGVWSVWSWPLTDPDMMSYDLTSENIFVGGSNIASYSNPEVDQLFDEGRITIDIQKRTQIYEEMQLLVSQDVPLWPLYEPAGMDVWNTRVKDMKHSNPFAYQYFMPLETAYLETQTPTPPPTFPTAAIVGIIVVIAVVAVMVTFLVRKRKTKAN